MTKLFVTLTKSCFISLFVLGVVFILTVLSILLFNIPDKSTIIKTVENQTKNLLDKITNKFTYENENKGNENETKNFIKKVDKTIERENENKDIDLIDEVIKDLDKDIFESNDYYFDPSDMNYE